MFGPKKDTEKDTNGPVAAMEGDKAKTTIGLVASMDMEIIMERILKTWIENYTKTTVNLLIKIC